MRISQAILPWLATFVLGLPLAAALAQAPPPVQGAPVVPSAAQAWKEPEKLVLQDMTHAGKRLVSVGDLGVVLLSDDEGKTFRQARSVPTDAMLNAVEFADEKHGWAVGHWGIILATEDGGETWTRQRLDTSVDQPLFSVTFRDAKEGWAVGLWSIVLHTTDGGKNWETQKVEPPKGSKKADRNLFRIFLDHSGSIYVAAEQGNVLHSRDGGRTWNYLVTGYKGSFWTGLAASDGSLFVGGLRGNLYRSTDRGASWKPVPIGSKSSITDLMEVSGTLVGVGIDGLTFTGRLADKEMVSVQLADRAAITSVTPGESGRWIMTSKSGIVFRQ
jgi:photosystem II stability/assembly factor-like uncharacterized protein